MAGPLPGPDDRRRPGGPDHPADRRGQRRTGHEDHVSVPARCGREPGEHRPGTARIGRVRVHRLLPVHDRAGSRAIAAARAAGAPILANLGGDPAAPEVLETLAGHPRLIVQTSIPEASPDLALAAATGLQACTRAEWAVVTAGEAGAVAASRTERLRVPGYRVPVRHTHCAGAAFSGGLAYGLLRNWPISDTLRLASASGALRCERAHHEPLPTMAELDQLIQASDRDQPHPAAKLTRPPAAATAP